MVQRLSRRITVSAFFTHSPALRLKHFFIFCRAARRRTAFLSVSKIFGRFSFVFAPDFLLFRFPSRAMIIWLDRFLEEDQHAHRL